MSVPLGSGSLPPTAIFMIDFILPMLSSYFTMMAAALISMLGVLEATYLLLIRLFFYSLITTYESAII